MQVRIWSACPDNVVVAMSGEAANKVGAYRATTENRDAEIMRLLETENCSDEELDTILRKASAYAAQAALLGNEDVTVTL